MSNSQQYPEPVEGMGPLRDGGHVVIIGGGPGGAACAIVLRRLAQSLGRDIRVTVYEGKTFAGERHYNQCVGVVSPPIVQILENDLGVPYPWHLVQRLITGYVLHGEKRSLLLTDASDEPSYAMRRVTFDAYLLEQAEAAGAQVVHTRVTDLEIDRDGVIIYSESDNRRADVLVGAFGLDPGTATAMARATAYRPPKFLDSIVTKIHPPTRLSRDDAVTVRANSIRPYSRVSAGHISHRVWRHLAQSRPSHCERCRRSRHGYMDGLFLAGAGISGTAVR